MMKWEHIWQIIGIAILTAMLVWMVSCKTPQPVVQTEIKEVIVEREVRDTIVTIAPDSASIKALLECDSAGNVLIKELQEAQGKNVKLQAQLNNANKGISIVIECKQDSLERVIALQNEKISELSNNKKTETIEVKYIPTFVKVMAWIGGGLSLLLLIWIVLKVYKIFTLKV